jgi:plastocyanin
VGHRLGRVAARLGTVVAIVLLATIAAGTPTIAAGVTVRIGHSLEPAALRITPGTTVTWVNADDERHRVRSTSGPFKFDSGNLEPGERFSVRFAGEGRWRYLDDRNREVERYWGTVTVASASATGADGGGSDGKASASGGGGGAPAGVEVGMAGRAFSPGSVTIVAGSTVTWANDDDREHTVSATDGAFDSGVLDGGETYAKAFTTAGTYRYLCAIHPEMTGTIAVKAPSGATPPPAATPAPTPEPTPTPATATQGDEPVQVVDLAFTPADVEVPPGTTVTWHNEGAAMHTVTAGDGSFDSGFLASGATWSRRFDATGTYDYVCSLHPDMAGRVVVGGTPVAGGLAEPPASAPPAATPTDSASQSTAAVGVVGTPGASFASAAPDPMPASAVSPTDTPPAGDVLRLLLVAGIGIGAVAVFARIVRATFEPGL